MANEQQNFSKKKIKKVFVNKDQPDFIKIESTKIDNSSELASNNLKSMFAKLNPKKKAVSKSFDVKKQPKIKKDYAFELTGKKPSKKDRAILPRKRKSIDVNEGPCAKVLKLSKKVSKERNSLKETPNEYSENIDLENIDRKEKKKLKNQQQDRSLQRSHSKVIKQQLKDEKVRLNRTLFVGNLPISVTRKVLEKLFNGYGSVESVRLRGVIPQKEHMPKKIAEIKRSFHSGLQSLKGFVVFKNEEQAMSALALNGHVMDNHHIIVNRALGMGEKKTYDDKRSIFVGNLPFSVEDEVVWNSFAQFGDVEAVRVIRDKTTGIGKGFGYILFQNIEAKESALNKESIEIEGRNVRIQNLKGAEKNNSSPKQNFAKSRALNLKHKANNTNNRKSVKKIMKREKLHHEKKKVANAFKKYF